METKVIEQDVFEEIQKRSFANVEKELVSAGKVLSQLAGKDLYIRSVNEDYVVYRPAGNSNVLLKATYSFTENDTIKLKNFERLVIDENSVNEARRNILRGLVDALYNDDTDTASEIWNRVSVSEMVKSKAQKPGKAPGDAGVDNADEEGQDKKGKARSARKPDGKYGSKTSSKDELLNLKAVDDALEEYAGVLPNYNEVKRHLLEAVKQVAEIVCEQQTGIFKIKFKDVISENDDEENDDEESDEKKDEKKDKKEIDEIEIDTDDKKESKKKNSEKSKKHREKVKKEREKLSEKEDEDDFEDEVVDVKRKNNEKDEKGLGETLMNLVAKNPSIIYVSKNELKEMVSRILAKRKEKNWDKELCEDIAYGLKKLAHSTYTDQAYDIIKYAATDEVWGLEEEVSDDDFEAFEQVSERYFEDVYKTAEKQYNSLTHLSEMLAKTASTLEADAKVYDIDPSKVSRVVTGYREYASQIMAQAHGPLNENIVRMVVGSLLTGVGNDYSLNQGKLFVDPGHFHKNFDLDDDNYKQHAKGGTKDIKKGDEEISISNPMTPKSMGPDKLDLEKTDGAKDFSVMKTGIHTNPMAPKAMGANQLDPD